MIKNIVWRMNLTELSKKIMVPTSLLLLALIIPNGYSQVIISNQRRPRNIRAGRTVVLEEVGRIRDDGKNSIFKNPRYFSLLNDGSLVFFDTNFLYKYDKDQNLAFKVLKEGTGPGECQLPSNYFINGDRIHFFSWIPPKVLEYDINGRYLGETKTPYYGPFVYLGHIDNRIYGIRDEIRFTEFIKKKGFFETPYVLCEISKDLDNLRKIYDIPVKHYIKNVRWWRRATFVAVPFEYYLFIVHTSGYEVDKFNLRNARIERIFKRPYARLKSSDSETEQDTNEKVPKQYLPPPEEFVHDILWIQIVKNSLWIFTSTTKDEDGVNPLIDVFDMEGKYVDCFYMKFPMDNENHWVYDALVSDDGLIFIKQENKDTGLISIGKYRMRDYFNP